VTYVVRSGAHEYVVRRRPVGDVPAGAHDMAREYRVLAALGGGSVPVPTVFGFSDDETIVGAPFYVMSLVHGVVFHRRDDVASLTPTDAGEVSHAEGFVARRIGRWLEQWDRGPHRDHLLVERVGASLAAAVPVHAEATLVHGDYRLGNMLVATDDPIHVAAILDWEMSTLGDPLTDLAHLLVYWEPTCGRVTHESQSIAGHPGFLSGAELGARYAAASGRDVDGIGFYLAFEHWRAAIIKEAIFQRRRADTDDELGDSVALHLEEAADLLATVSAS
jgi:aminoglycoside phosphotransferase (APT) family kinase protein